MSYMLGIGNIKLSTIYVWKFVNLSTMKNTCTKRAWQGNRRKTQTGGEPQSRTVPQENHCWKISKHGWYLAAARDQKETSRKEVNLITISFHSGCRMQLAKLVSKCATVTRCYKKAGNRPFGVKIGATFSQVSSTLIVWWDLYL